LWTTTNLSSEAKLKAHGLRSRIHQRASRNHALSKAQENANHQKSKVQRRTLAADALIAGSYLSSTSR
jgi:hypothetical protein